MIVHRSQERPGLALVTVEGEVDLTTADAVRDAIVAAIDDWHPTEVQVNLAAVPFMDSMGISALLAGYRAAAEADAAFRVVAASPGLVSVLRLTGLLEILGYEPPNSSIAR